MMKLSAGQAQGGHAAVLLRAQGKFRQLAGVGILRANIIRTSKAVALWTSDIPFSTNARVTRQVA